MLRLATCFLLAGCGPDDGPARDAGGDAGDAGDAGAPDATPARWEGSVGVLVVDGEGSPVEGAFALVGGRPPEEWATTDAKGRAIVEVRDVAFSERWMTAGKRGWYSGGVELDDEAPPAGDVTVTILPLPDEDNVAYEFQEGGYEGHALTADKCMHCHITIGDQWNSSRHHDALSNAHTRDLFNGSALETGEGTCAEIGGRWVETGVPGSETGELESHCVVDRGVLPDLNDGCGEDGEPACDDPRLDRSGLARFGSCGDCHGAAITGAVPGAVDLNAAVGRTWLEGVACDLCHKIDDVIVGPAPGLDGAIRLRRPSQPSKVLALDWQPIMLGPYPDVLNPLMGGSYNPLFREAGLCSACHEFAQDALDPADEGLVDAARFPDGIPVHTTYSEWEASAFAPGVTCQECHMPVLREESSTHDIARAGLVGSTVFGWIRAEGEVRQHSWPSVAQLAEDALGVDVALEGVGGAVRAVATVRHLGAGHALPTGDPMRQVVVLLDATIDGAAVAAVGGRAVPDVGGFVARGVVGADVAVLDRTVAFAGVSFDAADASAVRFVRPTGEWDDYEGPGVGWHSAPERTPEEKGLPVFEVIGEAPVESAGGETVTLAADPPALLDGDVAFLVGDDHFAGAPGWLFAKVLVDRDGARGVHHYRAVDVASDNRIRPAGTASIELRFPLPAAGSTLQVTARVVYRRYADAVAREYGWSHGDLEIGGASAELAP